MLETWQTIFACGLDGESVCFVQSEVGHNNNSLIWLRLDALMFQSLKTDGAKLD